MNKNIIMAIGVVVVLLVGGYFLWTNNTKAPAIPEGNSPTTQEPTNTDNNNQDTTEKNVVMFTDNGYVPAELTIKVGETVVFKSESSKPMWTASAMHPSHTVYSGTTLQQHCPDASNTTFDQCESSANGSSWAFTFTKAGTWGYHNHVVANNFGKIIVQE